MKSLSTVYQNSVTSLSPVLWGQGSSAAVDAGNTPLSPVLRGEGPGVRGLEKSSGFGVSYRLFPLTPQPLSPGYRGEGRIQEQRSNLTR